MKHIDILAILVVVCLLAVPALSIADGNGPIENQNGNGTQVKNNQCGGNCQFSGPCIGVSLGAQNHYRQNSGGCHGSGVCDGTGPKRDGSCKT